MTRVTLRDIAREAGVSTGTVSMVLNGSPTVSPDMRERVRRVLVASGYVYNRRAANLRRRTSDLVGVCVCDLRNPFFAELLSATEAVLGDAGKVAILADTGESIERQAAFARAIREHDAAGLLLVPATGTSAAVLESIRSLGLPAVLACRHVPGVDLDYAGADNVRAAELAVEHLVAQGHRAIAFVGAGNRSSTARDRLQGYRRTMRRHKLRVAEGWVVECAPTREAGFAAVARLPSGAAAPTAAVCFNDQVAFGLMLALRRRGLAPGVDFAVVGIDGTAEAALWMPTLTTVVTGGGPIGEVAARLLLARLADPERASRRVILQPALVVGGSSDPRAEKESRALA
jgi:LacI family transcriptional regulator